MYVVPLYLPSPLARRRPHAVARTTPAIMSLTVLPTDMQIEIADHLAVTLDQPMDDFYNL